MSLAPTPHRSSSGRAQGEGAVMIAHAGTPSRRSGGVARGEGGGDVTEWLVRLRADGGGEAARQRAARRSRGGWRRRRSGREQGA
eukprot:5075427-Pleurochrysis_carterae.AAC.2